MADKNRVRVEIGGMNYSLMAEDDTAYIKKVASLVNEKMNAIGSAHNCLTNSSRAVLTALNIADDFLKTNDKLAKAADENEKLKRRINELESRVGKK